MRGRPSKLDNETIANLEAAFRLGASDGDACTYAGIGESTFYEWMARGKAATAGDYSDFSDRITRARAKGKVHLLAKIEAATDHDWRAAAWKLERMDPKHYGPQVRHRIGGDADAPPVVFERPISDAQLIRELTAILETARERHAAASANHGTNGHAPDVPVPSDGHAVRP